MRQATSARARFVILLAIVAACGRSDSARTADSLVRVAAATSPEPPASSGWMPELGSALLVASDSDATAVLLYPGDPGSEPRRAVTLMMAGGDTARAIMAAASSDRQCGDAPIVRLDGPVPRGWSAGFLNHTARPIRMDSIEALSSADSVRLASDVARLASALTASTRNRFSGLPFVVLSARRFRWNDLVVIVAHVVRRLNQEASPLEEHTLLIAERPDGSGTPAPYGVAHSERSEGSEETAEHFDVLAALRTNTTAVLLIARDQVSRTEYELLARTPDGGWQRRWRRTLAC